jgi:uncharacterized protein DUF4265
MDAGAVKVLLQEDEYVETLWADRVGPNLYRLDNSPFWAYGVSWKDVVEAHPDPDGMLRMTRVAEKSGHRTVRLMFDEGTEESADAQAILSGVNALGATYEGMNPRYLAIDIPPGVELMAIARFLTDRGVQWEHADPRYSQLYPDES